MEIYAHSIPSYYGSAVSTLLGANLIDGVTLYSSNNNNGHNNNNAQDNNSVVLNCNMPENTANDNNNYSSLSSSQLQYALGTTTKIFGVDSTNSGLLSGINSSGNSTFFSTNTVHAENGGINVNGCLLYPPVNYDIFHSGTHADRNNKRDSIHKNESNGSHNANNLLSFYTAGGNPGVGTLPLQPIHQPLSVNLSESTLDNNFIGVKDDPMLPTFNGLIKSDHEDAVSLSHPMGYHGERSSETVSSNNRMPSNTTLADATATLDRLRSVGASTSDENCQHGYDDALQKQNKKHAIKSLKAIRKKKTAASTAGIVLSRCENDNSGALLPLGDVGTCHNGVESTRGYGTQATSFYNGAATTVSLPIATVTMGGELNGNDNRSSENNKNFVTMASFHSTDDNFERCSRGDAPLMARASTVCRICNTLIEDRVLLCIDDCVFHAECLKCGACDVSLAESSTCFIKYKMVYCKDCYIRFSKFQNKCTSCDRRIQATDWVRRARDALYHLACFACEHCKRQLSTGEQFSLQEGRLLCKQHYLELVQGEDSSVKQKAKRVRTTFAEEQLSILQAHFHIDCNPDGSDLERIANLTGLSKRVTQVWFQNSRARQKKHQVSKKTSESGGSNTHGADAASATTNSGRSSAFTASMDNADASRAASQLGVCDGDLSTIMLANGANNHTDDDALIFPRSVTTR